MSIKCTSVIDVLAIDGSETKIGSDERKMMVHSVWNWTKERVTLEIDGHKYTILAHDLYAAIHNATNCSTGVL
jgi:hypothetical protein